ncbi:MAG: glycosyltransferase family 4 protein [Cytophagales bacterium]|nr:glycosyltransferase family 4 protein [Cytophagales bacterium]
MAAPKPIVIQVIDSLFRGGAQKVVVDIVAALPHCRHVVCYWTNETDLKPELEALGATLVRIPFYGMWSFPITWIKFNWLMRHYKPQILHSHMFVPNLLTRTLLRKKFKSVATYHGECLEGTSLKARVTRWLEKRLLHRSDQLIAVSNYIKTYLQAKLKTTQPIEVIHNYGRVGAPASLQPYLPLRMVATANNHDYKNYPMLLQAMHELRNQPVTLDIYGQRMEQLKVQAKEMELHNVQFHDPVADVTAVFSAYNVFIIGSKGGEGFSLALLEAMNSGLPVICSNIEQFNEAVAGQAISFDPVNVSDLVHQIKMLIRHPEQLESLSAVSRQRAQLFSKPIFVKRIGAVYGKPTDS